MKQFQQHFAVLVFLALALLSAPSNIFAQYPRVLSYTGVLADSVGRPLKGSHVVQFALVDKAGVEHSSGWRHTEQYILNGGMFYARLGDINSGSNMPFPALEGDYQLSIKVLTENPPLTLPPIALSASPYALYALEIADSTVSNSKIQEDAVSEHNLQTGSVAESKLADNAVSDRTIAPRSIDSSKIKNLGISGANIQNKSITEQKLTSLTANIGDVLTWDGSAWVSGVGVPVGTILPFAGEESDVPNGWLLCNGQGIPNGNEYNRIRSMMSRGNWSGGSVPDLRNMFLRGADNAVGTFQDFTTALPRNGYSVSWSGAHQHSTNFFYSNDGNYSYNVAGGSNDPTPFLTNPSGKWNPFRSDYAGDHTHYIFGGDGETRPVNISVNYIIKVLP